jgi:hypothetical protein
MTRARTLIRYMDDAGFEAASETLAAVSRAPWSIPPTP